MPKTNSNKKPKKNSSLRSFRRAYHEEYADDFAPPGLFAHSIKTFQILFKNWKFFGGLLLVAVFFSILFVGLMTQDSISGINSTIESSAEEFSNGNLGNFAKAGLLLIATVTTGGLSQDLSDNQILFLSLIFLSIWLATIYFLRHLLAGKKITLRDSLYNSFSPLASTFVVLLVILVELIPIFLVTIFYNSAVETDFLSTPFYALIFLIFALLMVALSGFLVSSSIIALVAVSAPGLYPLPALRSTYELMFGRRIKFIIRLIFLIFVVAFMFVILMLPIILLDGLLKSCTDIFASIPVIPFFLLLTTCLSFIYASAYIYLYYRRMLAHGQK